MKAGNRKSFLSRFSSIHITMLFCFLPLMIIVIAFFAVFSLKYTEQNILRNSKKNVYQLVKQVNSDIDSYITDMENIALMVYRDKDVAAWLAARNANQEASEDTVRNIYSRFRIVLDSKRDIYSIALRANNGDLLVNDGSDVLNKNNNIEQQGWYQEAMKEPDTEIGISSSHVQNLLRKKYTWVVTVSKKIPDSKTKDTAGLFFTDLNYDNIARLCSDIDLGNKGYIYIIDNKGNILYHPKQQLIYSGALKEEIKRVMDCGEDSFQVGSGDNAKCYNLSRSEKTGWTVVGVSHLSELVDQKKKIQMVYLGVGLLLILLSAGLIHYLSKRITYPIKVLDESVRQMEQGKFNKIDMEQIPENEIGSLSRNYNLMSDKIQRLMKENVEEQEQKRILELHALQAQINPHFLYNTLDSIVWMAEWGKNKEVVTMTSALGKLLRQTISNSNEVIPIRQELEHVRAYLEIQQMRYQDKLEYEIHEEKEVLGKTIVKLVIQPLVENAIYHGVKYLDRKGKIVITAKKSGGRILITVEDNGPGMSKEALSHIFEKSKREKRENGVGINNIQERLKLYYGEEYGLSYRSQPGKGTVVTMIIPDQTRCRR